MMKLKNTLKMAILGLNLASFSSTAVVTPTVSNTTDVKTTAPTPKEIKSFEDLTQILGKDFNLADLKKFKPKLEEALKNNSTIKEFKVTNKAIEFTTQCLENIDANFFNKFVNTFFSNQWTFFDTCSQASLEKNQNETEESFKKRKDEEKIIYGIENSTKLAIVVRYILILGALIAFVYFAFFNKSVEIGQQIIQ